MQDASSNYFELYDLEVDFQIDVSLLGEKHRQLMARYHPDKHTQSDAVTKSHAMQMSATINESYRILKSPLTRAGYLLELVGIDSKADNETSSDTEFLMQQMMIRETIEGAQSAVDPFAVLEQAQAQASAAQDSLFIAFEKSYQAKEFDQAREAYVKLSFFTRLQGQIDKKERELEDLSV